MCRYCTMIPEEVLIRLSNDDSLPVEVRESLSRTVQLDRRVRALRDQARETAIAAQELFPQQPKKVPTPPKVAIYDCRNGTTLPGFSVSNPGGSKDSTVKNTFDETTALAQFYQSVFNRNSLDNAGMTLISSVHYGQGYANAFWNGAQMTYGDGDGQVFIDFTRSNDVIAHENAHGVTQFTIQLDYYDEPGALNESLSDVFGSMFRQWRRSQNVNQADWLIGAEILGPLSIGKGYKCLRDMVNPAASHCLSPQIDHYSKYQPGMDPHNSSGVPNLAFATASKILGGNSWEKIGKVWYRAMTGYGSSPSLKMKDFANRTRKEASALFAGQTALLNAVDLGWKKVGL